MEIDIENIQKQFPNLYLEGNFVKGEINVCAVYDGKKLIHNPDQNNKQRYQNTFVKDVYEIKIDCANRKVYETGNRIEKIADRHIYDDGSCCLELSMPEQKKLSDFIRCFVCPFFVWQAYYEQYNEVPPWGEWSHGIEGIKEFYDSIKNIGRNDRCICGSGKKYKICCGSNS